MGATPTRKRSDIRPFDPLLREASLRGAIVDTPWAAILIVSEMRSSLTNLAIAREALLAALSGDKLSASRRMALLSALRLVDVVEEHDAPALCDEALRSHEKHWPIPARSSMCTS